MGKRVSLFRLYERGTHVRLEDEASGDYEIVWIQPLTTPEKEEAAKAASARRAVFLAARHAPTDTLAMAARDEVEKGDWGTEFSIAYLVADELYDREQAAEAELSLTEEWRKDGYLVGLRDAWDPPDNSPGLRERYAVDPEDVEAKRVFDELKRFQAVVDERIAPYRQMAEERRAGLSQDQLYSLVVDKILEERAELAWSEEFRRCQIWKGTRVCGGDGTVDDLNKGCRDDHRQVYFASRKEVDELHDATAALGERPTKGAFLELRAAHARLSVDVVAGKDSPALPSSSDSSDPSTAGETANSSGLVDATA